MHGAKLVSENFPMFPSKNPREAVTITVQEKFPNLFEQLQDKNGNLQKNGLWGFRMLEKFLDFLAPIFNKEMGA